MLPQFEGAEYRIHRSEPLAILGLLRTGATAPMAASGRSRVIGQPVDARRATDELERALPGDATVARLEAVRAGG